MNITGFLKQINIDTLESTLKWNFIDRFFSSFQRSKLKNKDFSIIGNNCFVGGMYHKFGLAYTTPTIWTYIFPEEYIRFLGNLDWYLKQPLKFKKETNHLMAHRFCERMNRNYPIGVLGEDVEVHFMHYYTEEELPYKHKIFFSSKPYGHCKSTVFVKDYANATHVYDSTHNRKYEKYLDLVKWLNGEDNFLKTKN